MSTTGTTNGHTLEEHSWARGLFGPYMLGDLEPDEERVLKQHVAGCAACQDEERGLRETHEWLTGLSIAVSSVPQAPMKASSFLRRDAWCMERTISDSTLVEDTNYYDILYSAPPATAEDIGNFFSKHRI